MKEKNEKELKDLIELAKKEIIKWWDFIDEVKKKLKKYDKTRN